MTLVARLVALVLQAEASHRSVLIRMANFSRRSYVGCLFRRVHHEARATGSVSQHDAVKILSIRTILRINCLVTTKLLLIYCGGAVLSSALPEIQQQAE